MKSIDILFAPYYLRETQYKPVVADLNALGYYCAVNDENPPDLENAGEGSVSGVSLAGRIFSLQQEHRDLDVAIAALYDQPYRDQLQIQRLKKKKLQLKDIISRLKRDLIPDLNA